ncbi:beta strand repeat-containing protein, partial [Flavobacterium sp. ZB4R12]|uniref:beta strand repeat-containing protein n=1 Tax=Flavobacterium sp. ZB4R12 TaxID=3398732 RepID=UPI003AAC0BAB
AAFASNTITISGTPTAAGTFNYSIPLTGGCGSVNATGTITVTPNNTAGVASTTPTLCISTLLINITHATTGATGIAAAVGLPAGVTAAFASNTITISGTPTAAGTFNYSIPLTGGCGTVTSTGSIIVTPNNTIALSSAAGTDAQTRCISTAVTNITYATTGATGATFSGLPTGVTGSWAANVATITGTPTASGTFNYTVTLTGGCGTVTSTGSIIVTPNNTSTLSSAAGTNAQTKCINTAITDITYTTTGATGATFSGLPAGVAGSWAANVATITGTPTASGTFNYTVTLTGGCGTVTSTGSIIVTPNNTSTRTSAVGTDAQTKCISTAITNITYTTTGATGATFSGLPAGVAGSWAANVATITGTPTASGTFNYTVTLTGGCGTVTSTGS